MNRERSQTRVRAGLAACLFASSILLSAVHPGTAEPATPKEILLVISVWDSKGRPVEGTEGDANLKKHLETLGFATTLTDQHDPMALRTEDYDLIFLSSTIYSKRMPHAQSEKYKRATVPLINCEPALLGRLGMTGSRMETDWGVIERRGQVWINLVNAPHPLQAGLPNGLTAPFKGAVEVMNYGRPGLGAASIAAVPGEPEQVQIFGYEKGAVMDSGFPAPARRVMVCLNDNDFNVLSEAGLKLLNAAVHWAFK